MGYCRTFKLFDYLLSSFLTYLLTLAISRGALALKIHIFPYYDNIYVFRFFLVCYADRGLVKNGSVNLRLAKILYCVWLFTVILIGLAIFPVSQHPKTGAEFPDNSFKGRICQEKSLVSFLGSENNTFIEKL